MEILSYACQGFKGVVVSVDVDIRHGIPGLDIVGLPDNAVKESRERIRIAIKRSGFNFPLDKVLINLAPAGVRKEGAHFDLPLAAAVLEKTGQLPQIPVERIILLGELHLNGEIRGVRGVLPALMGSLTAGYNHFIIPEANREEIRSVNHPGIYPLAHLKDLPVLLECLGSPDTQHFKKDTERSLGPDVAQPSLSEGDFSDIKGQPLVKRGLEIAAAGRHNVLLFGPPGSGKTMAARRLAGIFPPLCRNDSLDVTRVWSLAGKLEEGCGILTYPVLRAPHHSASLEGLVGGGSRLEPGEVSLAHKGILFLDETPEFGASILQGLREPLENGSVNLSRAGQRYWFPADFQLVMAANPCPCGNLGREEGVCVCSPVEIARYWKKLGGALLDRIDIRVPVKPVPAAELLSTEPQETSAQIRERVSEAINRQSLRFRNALWDRNSRIPPGKIRDYCVMDSGTEKCLTEITGFLRLSSRAVHSVLKTARTIADLAGRDIIERSDLLEAGQFRRYGDRDIYWNGAD